MILKGFLKFLAIKDQRFLYFEARPKSLKEEVDFLKKNAEKRNKNFEYNFTIIYEKKIVGGCGIRIDQHRKYNCEIGYFVDKHYWNKGIATKALKLLEEYAFEKLKIKRIELFIHPKNKPSIRVAIKNGYNKEGILKRKLHLRNKYVDANLYAKAR